MGEKEQASSANVVTPENRRRSPRYDCSGTAMLFRVSAPDGKPIPGEICNLSLGGCCIEAKIPVERGTQVAAMLTVNKLVLRVIGEVRALRLDGRCLICIEFVGISADGLESLQRLITELEKPT